MCIRVAAAENFNMASRTVQYCFVIPFFRLIYRWMSALVPQNNFKTQFKTILEDPGFISSVFVSIFTETATDIEIYSKRILALNINSVSV